MYYTIIFSTKADYDLNKIKVWYDRINPKLTNNLLVTFSHELDRIKENPFLYQLRYREIRIGFLDHFEYGIHFIIKEDQIVVLRVLHTKQYFSEK